MNTVHLPTCELQEAPWNANRMDEDMLVRLRESVRRYGLVQNLVVRKIEEHCFEILSGNQRFRILSESGIERVPCVVVEVDDANARVLAQALNRIQGEDELGLKASLIKEVLKKMPQGDVMAVLPETANSLQSLASLDSMDIAAHLQSWERTRSARLKHLQFQLTGPQLAVVEKALNMATPEARRSQGDSPNTRGTALYLICRSFLGEENHER